MLSALLFVKLRNCDEANDGLLSSCVLETNPTDHTEEERLTAIGIFRCRTGRSAERDVRLDARSIAAPLDGGGRSVKLELSSIH
jgi:hypothetical protein